MNTNQDTLMTQLLRSGAPTFTSGDTTVRGNLPSDKVSNFIFKLKVFFLVFWIY